MRSASASVSAICTGSTAKVETASSATLSSRRATPMSMTIVTSVTSEPVS